MTITFSQASEAESSIIANLVIELTKEICDRTKTKHFDINLAATTKRCKELLFAGHYAAIVGWSDKIPVAVSTITETYALYAGGKIGVIQEFYVTPAFRSSGVGAQLVKQVKKYGKQRGWSCLELCTPPLPEFDRALTFYQSNGLTPVGGRKMRQNIDSDN